MRPYYRFLVAILVALERSLLLDADIGGLVGIQLRQCRADLGEVQGRYLFVEMTRQV